LRRDSDPRQQLIFFYLAAFFGIKIACPFLCTSLLGKQKKGECGQATNSATGLTITFYKLFIFLPGLCRTEDQQAL